MSCIICDWLRLHGGQRFKHVVPQVYHHTLNFHLQFHRDTEQSKADHLDKALFGRDLLTLDAFAVRAIVFPSDCIVPSRLMSNIFFKKTKELLIIF